MSDNEPIEDGAVPTASSPSDKAYAQHLLDRRQARPIPPKVKFKKDGPVALCGDEGALAKLRALVSTGLHNAHALSLVLHQLVHLNPQAYESEEFSHVNAALAMLDELEPKGGAQNMLAVQMVATHIAAMSCFNQAAISGQTFEGRELNLKFGTKLSGLYARQAETLSKLKRKGQQTVNVRHVHVHDGGQAVVGNIESHQPHD